MIAISDRPCDSPAVVKRSISFGHEKAQKTQKETVPSAVAPGVPAN
jgi:hypothetical protein